MRTRLQFISADEHVLQGDYAQIGTDVDIAFGLYEAKLGRPGICHAFIRFVGGRVRTVNYTGTVATATDPDSVCGNLVHDCLWHRQDNRCRPTSPAAASWPVRPLRRKMG